MTRHRGSNLLRTAVAIASLAALIACNTTAGMGQDISATGSALSNSADKAKPSQ
jgi:predicted small secreted protein